MSLEPRMRHNKSYNIYKVICTDVAGAQWTRTKIASGFVISESGAHQGTPGFIYPFFPTTSHPDGEIPHILVAGDGSQEAYLLRPNNVRD